LCYPISKVSGEGPDRAAGENKDSRLSPLFCFFSDMIFSESIDVFIPGTLTIDYITGHVQTPNVGGGPSAPRIDAPELFFKIQCS